MHPTIHDPPIPLSRPPTLQYLHSYKALMSSEKDTNKEGDHSERLKSVEMALSALSNVIINNTGGLCIYCVNV